MSDAVPAATTPAKAIVVTDERRRCFALSISIIVAYLVVPECRAHLNRPTGHPPKERHRAATRLLSILVLALVGCTPEAPTAREPSLGLSQLDRNERLSACLEDFD